MSKTSPAPPAGIAFPADEQGRRSTLALGRRIIARAAAAASGQASSAAQGERDWRRAYPSHFRRLVEIGIGDAGAAVAIARAGLDALHQGFEFVRGGEVIPLAQVMAGPGEPRFRTVVIEGTARDAPELVVPYRGKRLSGDALRRQLREWVAAGIAAPSVEGAVGELIDHPERLDLSDWHIALLGAGAELGPLRHLCRWRANVVAVDAPRPGLWRSLIATARAGNGRMLIPARTLVGAEDPTLAESAGADLLTETPEIRDWLAEMSGPLALGCHAYLDGEAHVRISMAMDAITRDLLARRRDVAPAFLLTPTDVYAVPAEAAEEAMRRWRERGLRRWPQAWLRAASANRLFLPNVARLIEGPGGWRAGIVDALVAQQGANYALAKRLQQWRAVAAEADGVRVSANVAPAARTASVVKNRALAAAYDGARFFEVEVFAPDTAAALMAALLVSDLRSDAGAGKLPPGRAHPLELLMANAVHGGLWRIAYAPRSALPFAALLGLVAGRGSPPV